MPSDHSNDVLLISGRGQGRLVERPLADGTKVHRSTVYVGKTEVLETWRGLTRTEAKRKHIDRVGQASKGGQPTARMTLGALRDLCWAACQEEINACERNGEQPALQQASLDNHKRSWAKR